MKDLKLDGIYSPEYYMEIEGLDIRLGMMKFKYLVDTLGDSKFSLIYSDKSEHDIENEFEKNIVLRGHLRHAIIDLSNSFDLLLQIPWFFYRLWDDYNPNEKYHDLKDRSFKTVSRNSDNWVETASKNCSFDRVHKSLKKHNKSKLRAYDKKLIKFYKTMINSTSKNFTVRELANMMKHKSSIKFTELSQPWNLSVNIENQVIDPLIKDLELHVNTKFYKEGTNEENVLGDIDIIYKDDIAVNITYKDGEVFRGIDYLDKRRMFSIDDVWNECSDCFDGLVDLYIELLSILEEDISPSPVFNMENVNNKTNNINMDKYFKCETP